MSGSLNGKICLVTGAGHGIGRAIAEQFAMEGATVYANELKEGSMDEWVAQYTGGGRQSVIPMYFDITDAAAAKEAIMRIRREQGRIDVLVNNAGLASNELLGMISRDMLRRMFEVNVYAVIELIQLVSRLMSRQKSGSIINISSIVGVRGDRGRVAYSASKGAVISLTRSASKELAPSGVRVNAIAPGITNTGMLAIAAEDKLQARIDGIGMGRLAEPIDIANACVFLASDKSAYITGQILGVDGGAIL
ncbi:MAG: SDR family NAD(P)-dependent oxidoreductase [Christensenellales bacterium]